YITQGVCSDLPLLIRINNQKVCVESWLNITFFAIDAKRFRWLYRHRICKNSRAYASLYDSFTESSLKAALDTGAAAPYIKHGFNLVSEDLVVLFIIGAGRVIRCDSAEYACLYILPHLFNRFFRLQDRRTFK